MTDRTLFRNRDFVLLWLGQDGSSLGTWLLQFALLLAVYDATGSASLTTAVFLAETLPQALVGGRAGALADRFDRRTLLIAGDLASALLTVPLLLPGLLHDTVLLCALLAGKALVATVFYPAYKSFVPAVVPAAQLPAANSLMFLSGGAVALTAPLLGALVYGRWGIAPLVYADLASFALSLLTLSLLRTRSQAAPRSSETAHDLRGWRVLRVVPVLIPLTIMGIGPVLADAVIGPTFAPYLKGTLRANDSQVGLLVTAMTAGSLAGAGVAGWAIARLKPARTIVCAVAAGNVLLLGYALAPAWAAALVAMTLIGVLGPFGQIAQQTLFQTDVPDHIRGRAFGVYAQCGALIRVAGGLTVAATADTAGVRTLLLAATAISAVSVAATAHTVWVQASTPKPELTNARRAHDTSP